MTAKAENSLQTMFPIVSKIFDKYGIDDDNEIVSNKPPVLIMRVSPEDSERLGGRLTGMLAELRQKLVVQASQANENGVRIRITMKAPTKAYKPDNKLGWTPNGFKEFVELTKPGSSWSLVKSGWKDPNRKTEVGEALNKLYTLFRGQYASYKPLADLLTKLSFAHNRYVLDYHQRDLYGATNNEARMEHAKDVMALINQIQPRLRRLWEFSRQAMQRNPKEASDIAQKHALSLIAQMRSRLMQKYRDSKLVSNMMVVFVHEIKQDLEEGNESHGDYNEIDITYDAWDARYLDMTPDEKELEMYKRGQHRFL